MKISTSPRKRRSFPLLKFNHLNGRKRKILQRNTLKWNARKFNYKKRNSHLKWKKNSYRKVEKYSSKNSTSKQHTHRKWYTNIFSQTTTFWPKMMMLWHVYQSSMQWQIKLNEIQIWHHFIEEHYLMVMRDKPSQAATFYEEVRKVVIDRYGKRLSDFFWNKST